MTCLCVICHLYPGLQIGALIWSAYPILKRDGIVLKYFFFCPHLVSLRQMFQVFIVLLTIQRREIHFAHPGDRPFFRESQTCGDVYPACLYNAAYIGSYCASLLAESAGAYQDCGNHGQHAFHLFFRKSMPPLPNHHQIIKNIRQIFLFFSLRCNAKIYFIIIKFILACLLEVCKALFYDFCQKNSNFGR